MSLRSFLIRCREAASNWSQISEKIRIVVGNEACDLDSAVSAISFAFHLQVQKQVEAWPMLNIHRNELRLKTEVCRVLEKWTGHFNLEKMLIFGDSIDLHQLKQRNQLELCLVDHHCLQGGLEALEDVVVEVLDHREIAQNVKLPEKTQIELVGSCSTLVAQRILEFSTEAMDPSIFQLLYAAILTDTICLSEEAGKTTAKDWQIVKLLEENHLSSGTESRQKVFDEVQKAKADVSMLSATEILHKDAKFCKSVAFSSIPICLEAFLRKEDSVQQLLTDFCVENGSELLVLLTCYTIGGKTCRQLAVFTPSDELRLQSVGILNRTDLDLHLEPLDVGSLPWLQCFTQRNIQKSRKQILQFLLENLQF